MSELSFEALRLSVKAVIIWENSKYNDMSLLSKSISQFDRKNTPIFPFIIKGKMGVFFLSNCTFFTGLAPTVLHDLEGQ